MNVLRFAILLFLTASLASGREPTERLKAMALAGDTDAMVVLGARFLHADGEKRDYSEAGRWYRMAAVKRDFDGAHGMGTVYLSQKEYVTAYAWFALYASEEAGLREARDDVYLLLSLEKKAQAKEAAAKLNEVILKEQGEMLRRAVVRLEEFETYRDETFQFLAAYPKSWKRVTPKDEQTRLTVISEQGMGEDDLNVSILSNELFKKLTPADYVSGVNTPQMVQDLLKAMRQKFIDAKWIENGKTRLGGEEAFYFTADVTLKKDDLVVVTRQIQVSTVKNGKVFYVTCRTTPEAFEKKMPLFRQITERFVLPK